MKDINRDIYENTIQLMDICFQFLNNIYATEYLGDSRESDHFYEELNDYNTFADYRYMKRFKILIEYDFKGAFP